MKIQVKVIGFVSASLVVPLLLGIFYVRHFGKSYYERQQGIIHLMIAEELAGTFQDGIRQKFEQVLNWVHLSSIPSLAETVPVPPLDMDGIQRIESGWAASAATGGIQRTILSTPVSDSIRAFQQLNPEFAEILMTDRHGRLIGASNPTTDYWQADEPWWAVAATVPSGKGHIQGLVLDESSGVMAIDMAFPVYSSGHPDKLLGVLKVSLNATRFLQRAAPRPWNRAIARDLVFPDGRVFVHINSGDKPEFAKISEDALQKVLAEPERWGTVELLSGTLSLAAAAPVRIVTDAPDAKDGSELYVVVSRNLAEAMMPVRDVLRQLTVWGIVTTLLLALIGYLLATYWFARPIKKLRNASQSFVSYIKQSEQGRLEESWESRQKARQRMNELETIQNRDELEGLAGDFIRMGDRMLGFFRQIEERLTDKDQQKK